MKKLERIMWASGLILFAMFVYFGNGNHIQMEQPHVVIPDVIVSHADSQEVIQLRQDNEDLRSQIKKLQVQLKTLEYAMKQTKRQMAELQQAKPYPVVLKEVQQEVSKQGGFARENQRILGDILDVSRIRIVQ